MIKNLKKQLKKIGKKLKYLSIIDKLKILILTIMIIDLSIYIILYTQEKLKYEKAHNEYIKDLNAVDIQNKINDNNITIIKAIDLIKENYKINHIDFIKRVDSVHVAVITDNNRLFQINNLSGISASMNLEPILLKQNIPYKWSIGIEDGKYIYEPVLKKPKLLISSYVSEHIVTILLYSLLFIYLMKSMPSIGSSKFEIYSPDEIEDTFDSIVGLDPEIKKEIESMKNLIYNSSELIKYGIKETFNYSFSGPPGVGKTKTAMALSKELNVPIVIGTGNVETGFVGGGVSTIRSIFKTGEIAAYKNKSKTAIIFLDEAQTLLAKRGRSRDKWADDSANELLARLSGVHTNKDVNIIFITAANFDDSNFEMDEAMDRRFKKIYFRLPDTKERAEIIEFYLSKINNDILNIKNEDIVELSKLTTGLSPAKIETIIKEGSILSILEKKMIDKNLIMRAFEKVVIGHTNRDLTKEEQRKRVILHELGHFITEYDVLKKQNLSLKEIKKKLKIIKISSESISKYDILGFVLNENDDLLKTNKEYQEEIISLYGGMASEEFFYGVENVSVGAFNDIENATSLINLMVNEVSLFTRYKLNFNLENNQIAIPEKNDLIAIELSEKLFQESLKRVRENKELILFLYEKLLKEWVLYKDELFKYIEEFENENNN